MKPYRRYITDPAFWAALVVGVFATSFAHVGWSIVGGVLVAVAVIVAYVAGQRSMR